MLDGPIQPPSEPVNTPRRSPRWLRAVVLLFVVGVIATLLILGVGPLDMLVRLRDGLGLTRGFAAENIWLAMLAYAAIYVALASLALPGALWLTIGAGFLLGPVHAVPVAMTGLTLGALNTLLLVRLLAGQTMRERLRRRYRRLATGFENNQLSYVILLRLLPLPYFGVNLAAGLSGVRWTWFALGTLIGSLPSIILYAGFGAGLGSLTDMEQLPGPAAMLQPAVLIPLLMIIPLAVAPILWRRRQRRRGEADALPGKPL